jgi:hypothetical protein
MFVASNLPDDAARRERSDFIAERVRGLIVADLARCTSKVPEAETLRMAKAAAKFRFIIRLKRWDAGVPRSHGFAARG